MVRVLVGCELTFQLPQPTPMIAILNVHSSRIADMEGPDRLITEPAVTVEGYHDSFGNWCNRLVVPEGQLTLRTQTIVRDRGLWDSDTSNAAQLPVESLPAETLQYLLGSRYCETDLLSDTAWALFGSTPPGMTRVHAVVDYVHGHLRFEYGQSRATRTAWEAYNEGVGVCRDFAHLAATFLRCLNIPVRYCTGYISDIGLPPPYAPQDFAAWIEVYLGGSWHMFDPRNNEPRIGRILVARGRDAADVPLTITFGPHTLVGFKVTTEELS
jgi:transglutaminase-like putative cysteine protease